MENIIPKIRKNLNVSSFWKWTLNLGWREVLYFITWNLNLKQLTQIMLWCVWHVVMVRIYAHIWMIIVTGWCAWNHKIWHPKNGKKYIDAGFFWEDIRSPFQCFCNRQGWQDWRSEWMHNHGYTNTDRHRNAQSYTKVRMQYSLYYHRKARFLCNLWPPICCTCMIHMHDSVYNKQRDDNRQWGLLDNGIRRLFLSLYCNWIHRTWSNFPPLVITWRRW